MVLYCLNIVVTGFNQHSVEWDCVNQQIAVFIFGSPVLLFWMYLVFCVFWILRNVNFCVFQSFKVLVHISWKCVVKISIQHYCGTLLFEYCSNKVQSALCWMGLCESTNFSVYFWFPRFVVLYVPCILCFLHFEKCNFVSFEVSKSWLTSPENVL